MVCTGFATGSTFTSRSRRGHEVTTLRIQSVLFNSDPVAIERTLQALAHAARFALKAQVFSAFEMAYGDCSPLAVLNAECLERMAEMHPHIKIKYTQFGDNLGSARGHNTLLDDASTDMVLIMNPDVILAPNTLVELARPYERDGVGMVEARQLPVEHPKVYDAVSGETSWAATACALIPLQLCKELNGFDDESFFLYCDDVDLSWRIRLAGYKVIYQPTAVIYHDKRLGEGGRWMPGAAEKYYSAEAALFMTWKWSRPDITTRLLDVFRASDLDFLNKAAATFESRREAGKLPEPVDDDHKIGQFIGDAYAAHRYVIE